MVLISGGHNQLRILSVLAVVESDLHMSIAELDQPITSEKQRGMSQEWGGHIGLVSII